MALPTETVNIDVDIPNATEFASATMTFTLSGFDSDSTTGIALAPHSVLVELDELGRGSVDLWPVDEGTNGRYYTPVLHGVDATDANKVHEYTFGPIQPLDGGGPYSMADLLQAGGAIAEPAYYSVITQAQYEAVIAAAAAAASSASEAATSAATVTGLLGSSSFLGKENFAPGSVQNLLGEALGQREARAALSLDGRRISITGNDTDYAVMAQDHAPNFHWIYPTSGTSATNIDAGGMAIGPEYVLYHDGVTGSVAIVDVGQGAFISAPWINPADATVRHIQMEAGETLTLRRIGGNIVFAEKAFSQQKVTSAGAYYQINPDGLYTVRTKVSGSPTIAAGATAFFSVSSVFSLDGCLVSAITLQPNNTIPPSIPPQMRRMGTAHGLLAYQFGMHNPNGTDITNDILVTFHDVTRV